MSNTRPWILGAAALSVLLAVAGWFLLISPERGKVADLKSQREAQAQRNQQLQLDIAQLKADFASLPSKQAELAKIRQQLPNTPALPGLVRSLTSIASASGAGLSSVSPGTPVSVAANAAVSGTAAGAAPAGLVAIPVTIVVDGTYAQNELFLQKLQNAMPRAFLVQRLTITVLDQSLASKTPNKPVGNLLRSTINGQIFVLSEQLAATTTGATGAAGSTTATTTAPAS